MATDLFPTDRALSWPTVMTDGGRVHRMLASERRRAGGDDVEEARVALCDDDLSVIKTGMSLVISTDLRTGAH